jgi:hypothetical protein
LFALQSSKGQSSLTIFFLQLKQRRIKKKEEIKAHFKVAFKNLNPYVH